MKQTNFNGISGLVTFDDQGDRISEIKYEQLQCNYYFQLLFNNTDYVLINFLKNSNARRS